jgi:pSer/pThr/pTyr-binding forkhead associated (FHA) protein
MSLKIIVIKDAKPVDQFVFERGRVSIGRKAESDVPIKDPAVSGSHACIEQVDQQYTIKDLGSTNGIYLDGQKITQHELQHNDLITIGEHQLQILITVTPSVPLAAAAKAPETAYLEVLKGSRKGERIALLEGLTTVGEPGVQVAAVSKRHQGHFIIHVDGGKDKNRVPMVNGEPTGFKSRRLEEGDKVEIAGVLMEYHLQ